MPTRLASTTALAPLPGVGSLLEERIKDHHKLLVQTIWHAWRELVRMRLARAVMADAFNKRATRVAQAADRRMLKNILTLWRLEVRYDREMREVKLEPDGISSTIPGAARVRTEGKAPGEGGRGGPNTSAKRSAQPRCAMHCETLNPKP